MSPNSIYRWLLPASLVLNAFLGGILVGHGDHPHHPPEPGEFADRMAENMTPDDAAILRKAFASRSAALDQGHHSMDAVHRQIETVLEAPVFDAEALKKVMQTIRQDHEANDNAMDAALLEAATKLSPEGRKILSHARPGPPPKP